MHAPRRPVWFRFVLALALGALAASSAHAAGDCLDPLRENAGWRCHADVPGGQAVDYCLEHTNAFGADPASRFFKLIATGPYPGSCSCRAKGKLPGAAFGEDSSFLCLHRDTDAVVSGKHEMSEVCRIRTDGPDGGKDVFIPDAVNDYRERARRQLLEEYPDLRREVEEKQSRALELRIR